MDFLYNAFGQVLYFVYKTVAFQNYGLAIIIFTVVIKLALLPLTLKSMKSTTKMSSLTPEVDKLKEKYKNDQEKQNQEIQKLYKENNVSCAGGCLPMLLQFPILIGLYTVLRSPLSYMVGKTWESIGHIANTLLVDLNLDKALDIQEIANGTLGSVKVVNQLTIINLLNNSQEKLAAVSQYISQSELINLNFLGLNLGVTPQWKPAIVFGPEMSTYLPILILPLIAVILTVFSAILTKKKTDQNKPAKVDPNKKAPAAGMNNMMLYMLPLMTLYFAFILPASMSLYWILTYTFQIGQQLIINKTQDKNKKENQKVLIAKEVKKGDKK